MAILCLPVVLFIRLIRPVIAVRFGHILRHKIGHCPLEAEIYLLEKAAGLQPRRALDLFFFDYGTDGLSANLYAEHLARRHVPVYPWVEWLARSNRMLPNADAHRIRIAFRDLNAFADTEYLLRRFPQQIDLSATEEQVGWSELGRIGVPQGARFICFHLRESSYWSARKIGIDDSSDVRNSDIENYLEAMCAAAARGYYVLRIGASAAKPLPDLGPRIIDYATKFRTEFMDVFLAARCDAMVSTGSGIDALSYFCRRPLVLVNLTTWGAAFVGVPQPYICIFKRFRQNGRLMTMSEVVAEGAQEYTTTKMFAEAGIELEQNSPDEITAAVVEMMDRLEGRTSLTESDVELQARMRAHIARSPRYREWQFEVSTAYLRKYRSLL